MPFFFKATGEKLREQEDLVYRYIRSNEVVSDPQIREYFDIYLELMARNIGNLQAQLLFATVFVKYLQSFVSDESGHLSERQIFDIQATAERVLVDARNGWPSNNDL